MPNYFRNLPHTMHNIDPATATTADRVRMWLSGHLRVVWTLVMMLVLGLFCLWAALKVGEGTQDGAIVETILPEAGAPAPEQLTGSLPAAPAPAPERERK